MGDLAVVAHRGQVDAVQVAQASVLDALAGDGRVGSNQKAKPEVRALLEGGGTGSAPALLERAGDAGEDLFAGTADEEEGRGINLGGASEGEPAASGAVVLFFK